MHVLRKIDQEICSKSHWNLLQIQPFEIFNTNQCDKSEDKIQNLFVNKNHLRLTE